MAAILNATAYKDGYYTVPCSLRSTGPPVGFNIGDGTVYMSAEDYVLQVSDPVMGQWYNSALRKDQGYPLPNPPPSPRQLLTKKFRTTFARDELS